MKKISIILIFLLTTVSVAQANTFSLGPRLGGTCSKLVFYKNQRQFRTVYKLGYQAGVVSQIKISNFFVQPEALFTGSRAQIVQLGKQQQEFQLSFYKLDIPTMVGLSVLGIRLQAGPVFSIMFSAMHPGMNKNDLYKRLTLGYQAGVGYDIWNLILDLKFEGNLTKFGKKIVNIDTDHRLRQVILSVGFNLLPFFKS